MPPHTLHNEFVINLCASTTPVALTPPDHAGLKRFTFFVSRRREEGRERFRLHMGYFDTQEEAERLLDIVREIYPGAWAGLAPGQRLRRRPSGSAGPGTAQSAIGAGRGRRVGAGGSAARRDNCSQRQRQRCPAASRSDRTVAADAEPRQEPALRCFPMRAAGFPSA